MVNRDIFKKVKDIRINKENRKYFGFVLVFLLVLFGLVFGLVLLQKRQEYKKAAGDWRPTRLAIPNVNIFPEVETIYVGETVPPRKIFFNTSRQSISGISVRLSYSYSGEEPEVRPIDLTINPDLNSDAGWVCPVKSVSWQAGKVNIDISCVNVSTTGYSASEDTLLASFGLDIRAVPAINPLVLNFDREVTMMTRKQDSQNILVNYDVATYTVRPWSNSSQTPTMTPRSPSSTPTLVPTRVLSPMPTLGPTAVPTLTVTPLPSLRCDPTCFYGQPQCSARVTPRPGYSCQLNYNCPSCNRTTGEWCWAYCTGLSSTCDSKCSFGKSQCERDNKGKTGGSCQINPACPGVRDDNYQSYWRWSYCW